MVQLQEIQDFPKPMRDSVATLPFKAGGSATLTASTEVDLVFVSDLRRFENSTGVAYGVHDGGDASTPSDSSATFIKWGVKPGDLLFNVTKLWTAGEPITSLTETSLTYVTPLGGTNWSDNDVIRVDKVGAYANARAEEIRKVWISVDAYTCIRFDGGINLGQYDVAIPANGIYEVNDIRVVNRITAYSNSTPTVDYTVWGI